MQRTKVTKPNNRFQAQRRADAFAAQRDPHFPLFVDITKSLPTATPMDWLTQAFPNCSQATVKSAVRHCNGDYLEAHKVLKAKQGRYSGMHAASETMAVSKTGRAYETTQELTREATATHRSLLDALPNLPLNFVTELFRHLAFPRPENMAEITAEIWVFVVEQVLHVGSPISTSTVGQFLESLTDFMSHEYPPSRTPKYLNIRGLISAYKFVTWISGIVELPESGYEIECEMCCEEVHPRDITVCTGAVPHNCCYSCARGWAGNQIDDGNTMKCVHNDKCEGQYSNTEAGLFLNAEKYAKLERQRFGLEKFEDDPGWFQCPLDCGFSGIVDNLQQLKHFYCPNCKKTICMNCKRQKHVPLSCTEYQNDPKAAAINRVAEAMHKASVRTCNKCGKEFEKQGRTECNQVKCLICGNIQCYICSATIPADHSHFRRFGGTGTCDLYDDPGLVAQIAKAKGSVVGNLVQTVPGLRVSDFDKV